MIVIDTRHITRYNAPMKQIHQVTKCEQCKVPMKLRSLHQKFCSGVCRVQAFRRRKRNS